MKQDRAKLAYELRESGLKLREVGERLGGVSASRARDLAKRWEWKLRRPADPVWDEAVQHGIETRVINAYRCAGFYDKDQIRKALIDGVKVGGVAKTGNAALRKWIGLPAPALPAKEISQGAIRGAITLLERAGYRVIAK